MPEIDIILRAYNQASAAIGTVKGDLNTLVGSSTTAATALKVLGSAAVIGTAVKVAQWGIDTALALDAMREESEQVSARFIAQAGSTRSAAEALSAMNATVGQALTNDEKMAASGQLMALGLARSSQEAANLANIAVNLGSKTEGAAQRIEGLTQIMVSGRLVGLKEYGISMQEVAARAQELQRETAGLSDIEAKRQAIFEIGTANLNAYTAAGGTAVTVTQSLTNAWADYQDALANNVNISGIKGDIVAFVSQATANLQIGSADPLEQLTGLESELRRLQGLQAELNAKPIHLMANANQAEIDALIARISQLRSMLGEESRWSAGADRLADASGNAEQSTTALGDALNALYEKSNAIDVNATAMAIFQSKIDNATGSMLALGAVMAGANFTLPKIDQGLDPSGVGRGQDTGAERIRAQQVVDATLEGYRLRQDEATRLAAANVRAADATQAAWESAFNAIAGAAESEFSAAQDQLKKLMPGLDTGGLGSNAPGTNGPFEGIFRAADVANLGQGSPWAAQIAAQLGVSNEEVQAKAKEAVEAFAQGFRTPEVRKLIDEAMLVDQVKQAEAAKASLDSWGKEIAKQAGVNTNLKTGGAAVFDSAFGADKKTGKNEAAEVAAQNASTLMVDALGSKLKDEAGRAIGFGQTLWGNFEEGIVDQAKNSGALRAAIDAMVAAALAGKSGPPPPGSGVSDAGKNSGAKL